jgi:hypothetical protein
MVRDPATETPRASERAARYIDPRCLTDRNSNLSLIPIYD